MVKLYGKIIKGKESMAFEFTDKDFSNYFGKEEDFKKIDRSSINWPTPPEDHHYPITLKDLYKNITNPFDY